MSSPRLRMPKGVLVLKGRGTGKQNVCMEEVRNQKEEGNRNLRGRWVSGKKKTGEVAWGHHLEEASKRKGAIH